MLTADERVARGLAARAAVPPEAHAELPDLAQRPDPVEILVKQGENRVEELVPIRYGRMLVSPFTFYRGAAAVMARDLSVTPVTGIDVQACGDAHLSNFGAFGSPERRLLFDINDFDETYPGPWEWDVKRLAASFVIAGREKGFSTKQNRDIVRALVKRYQLAMASFAAMRELEVWYSKADLDELQGLITTQLTEQQRKNIGKFETKARTRDSMQAYRKLVHLVDGRPRIISDPPLITPVTELMPDHDRDELVGLLKDLLSSYRNTLPSDRKVLLDRFEVLDVARKVVGVGSVGTRCWIVLMAGGGAGEDPLFLQVKEAQRSVLADHVRGKELPTYHNDGERVVAGQRLMQAASDIFLGWEVVRGFDGKQRDFYVRQLRDWKGSFDTATMLPEGFLPLAEGCAWVLARAHARSGDRIAIASYLGEDSAFAKAIATFAEGYADLNERDHAALQQAQDDKRIEVISGV